MSDVGTDADDALLLERAAVWAPERPFSDWNVEALAALAAEKGLDFATALVHDRAGRAPRNGRFRAAVAAGAGVHSRPVDIIGIVPGAFHGQHKHTGADGVRLANVVRGLAPHVEILPTRSFGPLAENATGILEWLERHRGARVALASLSKGGADVKQALASPRAAAAFSPVVAWVSFSGIVQGTPLVAWLRDRPLRSAAFGLLLRLQGHRSAVIDELRRAPDSPLARWPALPPALRIVHVNGCPRRKHLRHRWAPRGYERVAPLGPNDGGGILLGDLPGLPGIVYTVWGADHYLEPSWDAAPLLRSIFATALSDAGAQASQSATAPSAAPAARSIA